jgi:SAM-dependent methyltransferase
MHYGPDLAAIHHGNFGDFARAAAPVVVDELHRRGHRDGLVVDLGCGGGILSAELVGAGYDVLGVDISPEMVSIARREVPRGRFEVGSLFDADIPPCVGVTAIGEVFSYAADRKSGPRSLARLLRRIHGALAPRGVLVFDVATPGQTGRSGSKQVFHDHPDWSLHYEGTESAGDRTLRRRMTIFTKADGRDGSYRRSDEEHVLRLYLPSEVRSLLEGAGFSVRQRRRYGDFHLGPGRAAFVAAKKKG